MLPPVAVSIDLLTASDALLLAFAYLQHNAYCHAVKAIL